MKSREQGLAKEVESLRQENEQLKSRVSAMEQRLGIAPEQQNQPGADTAATDQATDQNQDNADQQ